MTMNEMNAIDPQPRRVDAESLKAAIVDKLAYAVGKDSIVAEPHDWLAATILVVRDRAIDRWMESTRGPYRTGAKRVYYLSVEFLIGRLLRDAMSNLGLVEPIAEALNSLGVDLDAIEALEPDAALGNGGLGRLAACFMESMASVGIPAYGYGIRYVHGLFHQEIKDGNQIELPEDWLSDGNLWEFERREAAYDIGFGGTVESDGMAGDTVRQRWQPQEKVLAIAYDTPIVGWRGARVNTLRLWSARAVNQIHLDDFNRGDHVAALADLTRADTITRVLYPADSTVAGQELRLRQEYFFVSASLQDLLRRHLKQFGTVENLPDKVAIQLNDTHPSVAVAELMRVLVDLHDIPWEKAWAITRGTISYTNHTLLPEALESWPVGLMERLLPRHMQIIYEINARLLQSARKSLDADADLLASLSLIDEHHGRRVRMGQLAFVGSHKVNGVSALHTELMKETVFRDLHRLYPERIENKTNGIALRRWLMQANPGLIDLLVEAIGPAVLDDVDRLVEAGALAEDAAFQERFAAIKRANKMQLAEVIRSTVGVSVDPDAMFDVQIKRIHEYKRQLLNILETIAVYNQIRMHPERDWAPRVKIFAGKAAASYWTAKQIIRLINDVARVINNDPAVRGLLKVVFLPNYNVSLAETIVPAADLSEQISTAGMEASGTGNMKLALNGAITIGTLDGANVEISERVGPDNIVIFGLTADEVAAQRRAGHNPRAIIGADDRLRTVIEAIADGVFSPDDRNRYRDLVDNLMTTDGFLVTADFDAYCRAQREVDAIWREPASWQAKAIRNTANMAWFSADRTIRQYARDIWDVPVG
ncbi:starch phosphorylase [Bauldia litoralis]|uniref:Alpha-1,4 glucan phosphorylase n=2 Tax=Bauldia litoralis TaxID=665467 RepID=A0A1G6AUW2_9HYPH|nr:starch phosphorylase [Bauldia litoralis]